MFSVKKKKRTLSPEVTGHTSPSVTLRPCSHRAYQCVPHPWEGHVYLQGNAQVFCVSPCRQSHWYLLGCSSYTDATAATNLTFMRVHILKLTMSVQYHVPTLMSNWDQQLCPCSCCAPIDLIRLPAQGYTEHLYILKQVNVAFTQGIDWYAMCEQGLIVQPVTLSPITSTPLPMCHYKALFTQSISMHTPCEDHVYPPGDAQVFVYPHAGSSIHVGLSAVLGPQGL